MSAPDHRPPQLALMALVLVSALGALGWTVLTSGWLPDPVSQALSADGPTVWDFEAPPIPDQLDDMPASLSFRGALAPGDSPHLRREVTLHFPPGDDPVSGLALVPGTAPSVLVGALAPAPDDPLVLALRDAGWVVAAYSLDGALPCDAPPSCSDRDLQLAMAAHTVTGAGAEQATVVLDLLAMHPNPRLPESALVIVAGVGPGANVALASAARDERIRAALAFAPQTLPERLPTSRLYPGGRVVDFPQRAQLISAATPAVAAGGLAVPAFLAVGVRDPDVRLSQLDELAKGLSPAGIATAELDGGRDAAFVHSAVREGLAWLAELGVTL